MHIDHDCMNDNLAPELDSTWYEINTTLVKLETSNRYLFRVSVVRISGTKNDKKKIINEKRYLTVLRLLMH